MYNPRRLGHKYINTNIQYTTFVNVQGGPPRSVNGGEPRRPLKSETLRLGLHFGSQNRNKT